MSQFADVRKLCREVGTGFYLFGFTEEFRRDINERVQAIGKAICEERGVSPTEAMQLLDDTELGPSAEKKFSEFKEWLAGQDSDYAELQT